MVPSSEVARKVEEDLGTDVTNYLMVDAIDGSGFVLVVDS